MEVRGQLLDLRRLWTRMDMRNPNKYYLYHHDHGYDTEEYIQLQDERLEEVITIT